MSTTPLKQPLPGEHIVSIEPSLTLFVEDAGWHRRANMYAGRALSAEALSGEQEHRAGRLALRGQMVSPGVVTGLEVRVEIHGGKQFFQISPGLGIAASGEDVVIPRLARIAIESVPVYRPKDGRGKDTSDFSLTTLTPRDPSKDHVAVLVLVPTITKPQSMDSSDPCAVDVDSYAFEDQRLVDGATVVLFAWPARWPMPPWGRRWRDRLVHWIFEYERWRGPECRAPWENIGVPLGLVGFRGDFNEVKLPPFVDRRSVVRTGGAPRTRTSVVRGHGNPLLWQARIEQFSEYMLEMKTQGLDDQAIMESLRHLPPVGILPKEAVDFINWRHRFFPPKFVIDAVPVPMEQLDAVLLASASLAPLRTDKPERVRVLVPVPGVHYDPRLIQTELLDRAFLDAIEDGLKRLGEWLTRRQNVRGKLVGLLDALEGINPQRSFAVDTQEIDGEKKYFPMSLSGKAAEKSYGVERMFVDCVGELIERHFFPWQKLDVESVEPPEEAKHEILLAAARGSNGRRYVLDCGKEHALLSKFDGRVWNGEIIHGPMGPLSYYTPTLLASVDGSLEIVVVSPRGAVEVRSRQLYSRAWTERDLGEAQAFTMAPAAISLSSTDLMVVLAVDKAGSLWAWQRVGGEWNAGKPIASGVVSSPVVVQTASGRISVFALATKEERATDARLRHWVGRVGSRGGDIDWSEADGPSRNVEIETFSACSTEKGRIDLFARALDKGGAKGRGRLVQATFAGGKWSAWNVLLGQNGEQILGTPAVAASGAGRIDVFVRELSGEKTVLWQASYDMASGWRWTRLGGSPHSSPTVIYDETNHFQVFVRDENRAILQRVRLKEEDVIDTSGVQGLLSLLQNKSTSVDNAIELQFTRVQADLYQLRQQMTGTTAASRMITSPALSDIVRSEPRTANKSETLNYTKRLLVSTKKLETQDGSTDIVGRLKVPPAIASWKSAVRLKYEVARKMFELTSSLVFDTTGVFIPAVPKSAMGPSMEGEPLPITRDDVLFSDLQALGYQFQGYVWGCLENEPNIVDGNESQYFSATVKLLEDTVSILRQLEDRVEAQQQQIAAVRETLDAIRALVNEANVRLNVIQAEIAEGRQDVTVARALCAEEEARLLAINQKRATILKEHVRFLVFQRPRQRDLTKDTPARVLDPGFYEDILPAVLASTAAAPSEIWSLVQLLQDVPLKWLRRGPVLLQYLDRIDLLTRTLERAKNRAIEVKRLPPMQPSEKPKTSVAEGLARTFAAQMGIVAERRVMTATMEMTTLRSRSWSELQRDALQRVALGDLADVVHGRSDVGKEAMAELERIAKVATGLYERFGEVIPAVRLEWAEQMSQYDAKVNLRDLARLPYWDNIEVTDRREMQSLVDWLFGRIDETEPEAVSLMNDLVRVCLLLASHAPVNEIISGHVAKPMVAQVGAMMDLVVDPARIRIGMHVLVESAGHTVQAVVEDLSATAARAKVFSATAATVTIAEKTTVKLSEPGRGAGAYLPAFGAKR